VGYLD
jgi:hypothetical protein